MFWTKPSTYENPIYPYRRSADQDAGAPVRHSVVVVGAGPVGLSLALSLAQFDVPVVLIDEDHTVSTGSRAICFAKRTLEIVDRLGAGERMLEKGVTWNVGKVFFGEKQVYEFDLQPENGHRMPAFVNLQQYYFEEYLVDLAHDHSLIDIRWGSDVVAVQNGPGGVSVSIETPEGPYTIEADYLLASDGIHSPIRSMLGLPYTGEAFDENFLIADIKMKADFPSERWFWFDPPFNPGQSALLHKQPDGVWRIDLQLGRDVDRERELDPERIRARLRQMLGEDVDFELEWTSIYRFKCASMDGFVHDRVIFVGDSAHQVSPFGARGANGGVQDADNLAWKVALVLQGRAPASLLDTYDVERRAASAENIRHSSQATDFISPKSDISLQFRNAVLDLAAESPFARRIVNSGRLSKPFKYLNSPLTTPDEEEWAGIVQPGYAACDAPLILNGRPQWFLQNLGPRFTLLYYSKADELPVDLYRIQEKEAGIGLVRVSPASSANDVIIDEEGLLSARYDLKLGSWYLFRPDQHIAARGRAFSTERMRAALDRAIGRGDAEPAGIEDLSPDYPDDERFNRLIKAHEGLSRTESDALNARLILMLLEEAGEEKLEAALKAVVSS